MDYHHHYHHLVTADVKPINVDWPTSSWVLNQSTMIAPKMLASSNDRQSLAKQSWRCQPIDVNWPNSPGVIKRSTLIGPTILVLSKDRRRLAKQSLCPLKIAVINLNPR